MNPIELSAFQLNVFETPADADLLLLGGKGSGKTHLVRPLALRHAEQYGPQARILYVRQSYGGARETEAALIDMVHTVFGKSARYNGQDKLFKLPERRDVPTRPSWPDPSDLRKFWGKNYSLIIVDEVGEYADLTLIDRLRPSLRPPRGVLGQIVLIGNPGGPSHAALVRRYIAGTTPWVPRVDEVSGRHFIWCPSTYRDNPHIDQAEYRRQLEAACAGDPALLAAWADGSFAVAKGAFFASSLDENRNAIEPWKKLPTGWRSHLAHDAGFAAPSVTQLFVESPGAQGPDDRYYSRGSKIVVDEFATNEPGSLTKGMGYAIPRLADDQVVLRALGREARRMHRRRGRSATRSLARERRRRVSAVRRSLLSGAEKHARRWMGSDASVTGRRRKDRRARAVHQPSLHLLVGDRTVSRARSTPNRRR